jgi:ferric-dicitrate binding protein FerR (iron transport regulator)
MTDRPNNRPDEETVAMWVRQLPDADADDTYRERLRAAFISGELGGAAGDAHATAPRPRHWRWVVPAVAAALAFVLVSIALINRGPQLKLIDATGTGIVRVDGETTELQSGQILGQGVRIDMPAGETIGLLAQGVALYEVTGGTQMTIPPTPGRWFNRAVECSVFVGELRLKTGARFPGSVLRVYTPDGIVEVTGTLLSIQCDSGGTCVCVLEGDARVGIDENDLESVTPGNRKIMLRDGTVEIIPVKPMHRDGVLDFDQRLGDRIDNH